MNAVRAEIAKLLTLPSLWITATLTWAVTLLLRAVGAPGSAPSFTVPGLLVFGVLAAAHEWQAGGQIRATLLAVPRRWSLALAKAVAVLVTAAPVAAIVAVLGDEVRATLPLALSVLVAAGAGTVLRNAMGAAGTVLTAYLIGFPLLRAHLAGSGPWLPDTAVVDPGEGLPGAVAWAIALLGLAALTLRRRDA